MFENIHITGSTVAELKRCFPPIQFRTIDDIKSKNMLDIAYSEGQQAIIRYLEAALKTATSNTGNIITML